MEDSTKLLLLALLLAEKSQYHVLKHVISYKNKKKYCRRLALTKKVIIKCAELRGLDMFKEISGYSELKTDYFIKLNLHETLKNFLYRPLIQIVMDYCY